MKVSFSKTLVAVCALAVVGSSAALAMSSKGRLFAVQLLTKYQGKKTTGDVVYHAVSGAYEGLKCFGLQHYAESTIGGHYEDRELKEKIFEAKPTHASLWKFAQVETEWWKEQKGAAKYIGGYTPAWARYRLLVCTAKANNIPLADDEAAELAQETAKEKESDTCSCTCACKDKVFGED